MLILAGVSLNAIIGDNGIINSAQSADLKSGMAALEEFLQEKYVSSCEEITNEDEESKVAKLVEVYPEYFYDPSKDSNVSINTHYITVPLGDDGTPYAFYLVNKSGLPEEIREKLIGGNAGEGKYIDYVNLNDVYGVTDSLKVYYISNLVNGEIEGVNFDLNKIGKDNPARVIFSDNNTSPLGALLSSYDSDRDGNLTLSEIKGIKSVNVDDTVKSLKEISNLSGLEQLYIESANITDLAGIENCSKLYYIFIKDSTVGDYSAIGKLGSRLRYLYLLRTSDAEVVKLGKGLEKCDLPNLQYFGLIGYYRDYEFNTNSNVTPDGSTRNLNLTDISPLTKFSKKTKEAIKYLYLNNNAITSLDALEGFKNVYTLRASTNEITSIKGLRNLKILTYCGLAYEDTGMVDPSPKGLDEDDCLYTLQNCTSLHKLDLRSNVNIKRIDYLQSCTNLKYIYLSGCTGLEHGSVSNSANLFLKSSDYSLDSVYGLDILSVTDTTKLNIANQTITKSQFENLGKYVNLQYINFNSLKIVNDSNGQVLTESELNTTFANVIPKLTKLVCFGVNNIKFSDLSCIYNIRTLRQLDVRNTKVTTLQIDSNDKISSGIKADKLSAVVYEYDASNRVTKAKTPNSAGNGYDTVYSISYTTDAVTNTVIKDITYNDSYQYFIGLNVLNSCPYVGGLFVNNSTDDFSTMQNVLERLNGYYYSNGFSVVDGIAGALVCQSSVALESLSKCDKLVNLRMIAHGIGAGNSSGQLDLSRCKSLKSINFTSVNYSLMTLPTSIEEVTYYNGSIVFKFLKGSNLSWALLRMMSDVRPTLKNMIAKDSSTNEYFCSKLETLTIQESSLNCQVTGDDGLYAILNKFPYLDNLSFVGTTWSNLDGQFLNAVQNINLLNNNNIKNLSIHWLPFENLNGLSNLKGLTSLSVTRTFVTDISGIAGLTNLTNLTISGAKVTSVSALKKLTNLTTVNMSSNYLSTGFHDLLNLKQLTSINLSSNSIGDFDTYKNENEEDVSYSVLSIFKTLNTQGSGVLQSINISNNYFSNYNALNGSTLTVTK